jgi:hypothetical protein
MSLDKLVHLTVSLEGAIFVFKNLVQYILLNPSLHRFRQLFQITSPNLQHFHIVCVRHNRQLGPHELIEEYASC